MYMYVAVPYELLFILSIIIITVYEYVTNTVSFFDVSFTLIDVRMLW